MEYLYDVPEAPGELFEVVFMYGLVFIKDPIEISVLIKGGHQRKRTWRTNNIITAG